MTDFNPYANESEALTLGGDFTVENRLDRVSFYGSLDLTRDREGLAKARLLLAVLGATVDALEAAPLPERIALDAVDEVPNPDL